MLTALALLSMKDAGKNSRDQWVWLQSLCSAAKQSGLDVPELLNKTAEWSSDTARFPPAPSTRALLVQFAERFAVCAQKPSRSKERTSAGGGKD